MLNTTLKIIKNIKKIFMIKNVKKILKKILPHKIEDDYHYNQFMGSFNLLRIISWNIFHPNRILNRILWKTIFLKKKKKIANFNLKTSFLKNKIKSEQLDFFLENGGVLIENFFTTQKINDFLAEYKDQISLEKLKDESKYLNSISLYNIIRLRLSKPLLEIWLNDDIIEFIKSFLGTDKIYAREYPRLVHTKYLYHDILTSRKMADGDYDKLKINGPYFWHIDHTAGLVNFHVLLEDVKDLTSTHMQFLPGSNKFFNSRDAYSDETIKKFKNKPIDCIGKKGSIYFHQGNTLHRVIGKKNSERLGLIFSFSKGAGIEFDSKHIADLLSGNYKFENLSIEKKQILSGIIPFNRMIEIRNDKINTSRLNEKIL